MKSTGILAAAFTAAITVACGGADRNDATGNPAGDNTTVGTGGEIAAGAADNRGAGDVQNWVNEIAMHNMAEIELGKLAQQKAANAQVKQYGEMMVRDHTMAGNELKQAVQGEIEVHEQMDEKHRELAQKLQGLSGVEFDREYMNAMVDGHEEVKGLLDDRAGDANRNAGNATATGANTANNASSDNARVETAVNQWAAKTLPKVEQHLQQAEQLRDRVRDNRNTTN